MESISLYLKYLRINLHSQLQYRASFILMITGSFLSTFIEFVGIWVLLTRFQSLKGWGLAEIGLFYGVIHIAFGLVEGFGRGFDLFYLQIINAEFDRTLLRPRATAFQVLAHDFQLMRAGRLLQGLLVLVWASSTLNLNWNAANISLLIFSIAGGALVFGGLLVLEATLCFWSTQSLEIMNSFTYGGVEALQWPLPIYNRWLVRGFIFIIPLGCVTYFPVVAVLGKADVLGSPVWLQWLSPLAGVLFMVMALGVWQIGVRHYRSTGS